MSTTSFEGLGNPGYAVASAPSDTTGAAGIRQYVQWVNTAFAVFDKASGAIQYGPADGRTLWTGFGGECEEQNDGDPIVLYDRMAGRWLLTQFAVSNGPPYFECVAVSRTSDATGSYARYAYRFDDFNDYPKFGIWPSGYFASFNMFGPSSFLGSKACAFERSRMLTGTSARMVCFDVPEGGLLPSDMEGLQRPPAGSPSYFLNFGRDRLNLWKFRVNWAQPRKSTFTGPQSITVAGFEPACATGQSCIPQPEGPTGSSVLLDSLGDRLMNRLAYRRIGSQQSLLANHSVTADPGSVMSGVRWYELRRLTTNPIVLQQGTYAPSGASRWMGSIAMDKRGNIAVGYSISGRDVSPSIRVAGRRSSDPPGGLGPETAAVQGSGSQKLDRWGDYSALTLDPQDDCTFWFTTQYLTQTGQFNWQTRIVRFKFPNCS